MTVYHARMMDLLRADADAMGFQGVPMEKLGSVVARQLEDAFRRAFDVDAARPWRPGLCVRCRADRQCNSGVLCAGCEREVPR